MSSFSTRTEIHGPNSNLVFSKSTNTILEIFRYVVAVVVSYEIALSPVIVFRLTFEQFGGKAKMATLAARECVDLAERCQRHSLRLTKASRFAIFGWYLISNGRVRCR